MADKKPPAKKKPAATAKPVRKPIAHKSKKPIMRSFKRVTEPEPFMTFKLTRQTLYWLIIAIMVVGFSVWIIKLQSDIMSLYDEVDKIRMSEPQLTADQLKKLYEKGYRLQ